MIAGLDHVALAVRDFEPAVDAYRTLLGQDPVERTAERARFQLANTALVLAATRFGDGLQALAFATDDLAAAHRLLTRRGLVASKPDGQGFRLDVQTTGGIPIHIVVARAYAPGPAALDHVVVRTSNADRAMAVYGAKLGLDLRLDRSNPAWNARLLFFKAGETTVEIGAPASGPPTDEADRFGGLAWRVTDAAGAQARLAAAGFDVSEVRDGRKAGTRVFTVRKGLPCAPALVIQQGES